MARQPSTLGSTNVFGRGLIPHHYGAVQLVHRDGIGSARLHDFIEIWGGPGPRSIGGLEFSARIGTCDWRAVICGTCWFSLDRRNRLDESNRTIVIPRN